MTRSDPADETQQAQVAGPQISTRGARPAVEAVTHLVLGYRASPYGEVVLHHGADLAAEQRDVEHALADLSGSWTYHAAQGDPSRCCARSPITTTL